MLKAVIPQMITKRTLDFLIGQNRARNAKIGIAINRCSVSNFESSEFDGQQEHPQKSIRLVPPEAASPQTKSSMVNRQQNVHAKRITTI